MDITCPFILALGRKMNRESEELSNFTLWHTSG